MVQITWLILPGTGRMSHNPHPDSSKGSLLGCEECWTPGVSGQRRTSWRLREAKVAHEPVIEKDPPKRTVRSCHVYIGE